MRALLFGCRSRRRVPVKLSSFVVLVVPIECERGIYVHGGSSDRRPDSVVVV